MKTLIFVIIITLCVIILAFFGSFFLFYRKSRKKRILCELNFLNIPRAWDQLNEFQLRYVAMLMTFSASESEIHSKCFLRFSGLKLEENEGDYWRCRYKGKLARIHNEELEFWISLMAFLTASVQYCQPLPMLSGKKHIYPTFEGHPLKHWLAAENYFQAFLFSKDPAYLNRLCAVIYPSQLDYFDDSETEKRAKVISKVNLPDRFTVFLYYSGLKNLLAKKFPTFFERSASNSAVVKAPDMRAYITSIMNALDGGDVTKDEDVYNAECWRAFATLEAKAKENKEMMKRLEKMKK